jgi:hypothetical protein
MFYNPPILQFPAFSTLYCDSFYYYSEIKLIILFYLYIYLRNIFIVLNHSAKPIFNWNFNIAIVPQRPRPIRQITLFLSFTVRYLRWMTMLLARLIYNAWLLQSRLDIHVLSALFYNSESYKRTATSTLFSSLRLFYIRFPHPNRGRVYGHNHPFHWPRCKFIPSVTICKFIMSPAPPTRNLRQLLHSCFKWRSQ